MPAENRSVCRARAGAVPVGRDLLCHGKCAVQSASAAGGRFVGTEFETIIPFAVENADSVTVAVDPTGGIPWSMVGQPNGVAGLDETGKVLERHLPELNFDPSGSAAAVQANLTAHTANKNNPHGVTAAQVGAFTKAQTLTAGTAALVGLGADAVAGCCICQTQKPDRRGEHQRRDQTANLLWLLCGYRHGKRVNNGSISCEIG